MMRSKPCLAGVLIGLLLAAAGCQSGAPGTEFLSLVGLSKKPVVVALTPEPGVLNPFATYEPLRKKMEQAFGRPVRLDLALPKLQLEPNLDLGLYHFAIVGMGDYAGIGRRGRFDVLAVSVDEHGRKGRPALLIVPATSKIEKVEDLRGKTVAFGPAQDARTTLAALALLREHGISKTDLSLQLLPVPGSLKHFQKMREIAQSVMNYSSDAGFIDVAAYDGLPETTSVENEPARDRLRVIARTMAVPDKVVLRSPKADDKTAAQFTQFLLTSGENHADALHALRLSGFEAPSGTLELLCDKLTSVAPAREAAPTEQTQETP